MLRSQRRTFSAPMRCSHRAEQPLRRGTLALARSPSAARPCSLWGLRPPGAPPRCARVASSPGGLRAGSPGGFAPPSLARLGLRCACPKPSAVVRACGGGRSSLRLSPPLFARFASAAAPGPLPLRASASGRRARPPLRGPAPALAPALASLGWRARPSGLPPRLPRSARVRRCAAPWALAGPAALGVGFASLRPPCSVGLASSRPPRCASRGPAGAPLGPPASRLRGRWPPAPGALARLRRAFFAPAPGAWVLLARLAALRLPPFGRHLARARTEMKFVIPHCAPASWSRVRRPRSWASGCGLCAVGSRRGNFRPALGAGSVRLQLRYRKPNQSVLLDITP